MKTTFSIPGMLILLFTSLIFLASCETEFDTYIESKATPVVYGVINPDDSLYQIRLSRSFVGPGNAYNYAQNVDSIYYPEAEVYLETYRWGKQLLQSVRLDKVQIEDREDGIFAESPNYVYQTDFHNISLRPQQFEEMGIPYENNELVLRAIIPGYQDTIIARTELKAPPNVFNPRSNFQRVYFYGEIPFQMEWTHKSHNNYFEVKVIMHYREVLEDGEREATADWVLTGIEYNENSIPGGTNNFYAYYMRPETFYSQVRASIPNDSLVLGRTIRNVDFIILTSDGTIREYNRIGEMADDYHGASYSNITNGIGIFTNFSTVGVYNLRLGQRELDSLAFGIYTKHLKFKNWE